MKAMKAKTDDDRDRDGTTTARMTAAEWLDGGGDAPTAAIAAPAVAAPAAAIADTRRGRRSVGVVPLEDPFAWKHGAPPREPPPPVPARLAAAADAAAASSPTPHGPADTTAHASSTSKAPPQPPPLSPPLSAYVAPPERWGLQSDGSWWV